MVSDMAYECAECKSIRVDSDGKPVVRSEMDGQAPDRDAEGYTVAERVARRPLGEIADSHLLAVQRARRRAVRRRGGRSRMFDDAVVPGSVRTSRVLFSTYKH